MDDGVLDRLISSDVVTDDDMDVFVSQLKSVFDVLDKDGEGEIAEVDLKRTVRSLIGKRKSSTSPTAMSTMRRGKEEDMPDIKTKRSRNRCDIVVRQTLPKLCSLVPTRITRKVSILWNSQSFHHSSSRHLFLHRFA